MSEQPENPDPKEALRQAIRGIARTVVLKGATAEVPATVAPSADTNAGQGKPDRAATPEDPEAFNTVRHKISYLADTTLPPLLDQAKTLTQLNALWRRRPLKDAKEGEPQYETEVIRKHWTPEIQEVYSKLSEKDRTGVDVFIAKKNGSLTTKIERIITAYIREAKAALNKLLESPEFLQEKLEEKNVEIVATLGAMKEKKELATFHARQRKLDEGEGDKKKRKTLFLSVEMLLPAYADDPDTIRYLNRNFDKNELVRKMESAISELVLKKREELFGPTKDAGADNGSLPLQKLQADLAGKKEEFLQEASENVSPEKISPLTLKDLIDDFDVDAVSALNGKDRASFVSECKTAIEEINGALKKAKGEEEKIPLLEELRADLKLIEDDLNTKIDQYAIDKVLRLSFKSLDKRKVKKLGFKDSEALKADLSVLNKRLRERVENRPSKPKREGAQGSKEAESLSALAELRATDIPELETTLSAKIDQYEIHKIPALSFARLSEERVKKLRFAEKKLLTVDLKALQSRLEVRLEKRPPQPGGGEKEILPGLLQILDTMKEHFIEQMRAGAFSEQLPTDVRLFLSRFHQTDADKINKLNAKDRGKFLETCEKTIKDINRETAKAVRASERVLKELEKELSNLRERLSKEIKEGTLAELPHDLSTLLDAEKIGRLRYAQRKIFADKVRAAHEALAVPSLAEDLKESLTRLKSGEAVSFTDGVASTISVRAVEGSTDRFVISDGKSVRLLSEDDLVSAIRKEKWQVEIAGPARPATQIENTTNKPVDESYEKLRAVAYDAGTYHLIMGSLGKGFAVMKKAKPDLPAQKEQYWETIRDVMYKESKQSFKKVQKDFGWTDAELQEFAEKIIREAFDEFLKIKI